MKLKSLEEEKLMVTHLLTYRPRALRDPPGLTSCRFVWNPDDGGISLHGRQTEEHGANRRRGATVDVKTGWQEDVCLIAGGLQSDHWPAPGDVLPYLKISIDQKIFYQLPGDRRSQGWLDSQMVLAIFLLNLLGWDRVSDIDKLEDDKVLGKIVRKLEPYFFGRAVPLM